MTSIRSPEPAESGNPADDLRAFRRCLSQFGTGVTVITAQAGTERAGVTVNSFSSLSLDPPLILWAINRQARSCPVFEAASHFTVNILASDQIEVSRCFATPAEDKFAQVAWTQGECGSPVLDNVLAALECENEARYEGGDHLLIVGRVKRFSRFEKEPLLFVQGRYGVAVDHPGLKASPEAAAVVPAENTSLMVLLLFAYQALSEQFEAHRKAEGLTLAQSRVLAVLYQGRDGLPMAELVRRAYLGVRDVEDAVADLADRSLLLRAPGQTLKLTAKGIACREAIMRHLHDFDLRQTSGLPAGEVEAVRRVLSHIIRNNQRHA
ncbi:flavin reductase [Ramlibacter sp. 2FC]|uniref:flavin reductase n=1 Tax=Ramlibacter sp. 2FC TaxID=2502188 RepID=UPI0010F477CF|nr:flavin reductase [Ramlibacter sp. 2FC]